MTKKNVLAIDDHPSNLKVLEGFVDSKLFDLTTIDNALDAISLCEKNQFDLVLMDIQLPGMNGIEATAIIRKQKKHSSIPIIGLTADAYKDDEAAALKAGMTEVLTKPLKLMPFRKKLFGLCYESKSSNIYDKDLALKLVEGNKTLAKGVLDIFIKNLPEQQNAIQQALANKDFKTIAFYSHKLHSAVSYCGLPQLLKEVVETEKLANKKDTRVFILVDQLLQTIEVTKKKLAEHI